MSHFKFQCPNCTNTLEVPTSDAGLLADCPECGDEFTIPTPRKKKIKSSRNRRPIRSQSRSGPSQNAAVPTGGNMHLVKDKITAAVNQHMRGDAPQSLIMGWTGVGLLTRILLGRFSKFWRKYYIIVIGENGVTMLQKAPSLMSIKIKSVTVIPWNQIQGATFKDGILSTYLTMAVAGEETRYEDVESTLLLPFVQNLQEYGVPVVKR